MVQNNEALAINKEDDKSNCESLSSIAKDIISLGERAAAIFAEVEENKNVGAGKKFKFDPLIYSAGEQIIVSKNVSASFLQKSFKISYVRAAKILEELETLGVLNGKIGNESRKLLLDNLDEWRDVCTDNDIEYTIPLENPEKTGAKSDEESAKEQETILHDFPTVKMEGSSVGISDNLIRIDKKIDMLIGSCTMNVLIPGKYIKGIVYKKPVKGDDGYFTFVFPENVRFNKPRIEDEELENELKMFNMNTRQLVDTAQINWDDSSDVCRIDFYSSQDYKVFEFLQQISADTGVPIMNGKDESLVFKWGRQDVQKNHREYDSYLKEVGYFVIDKEKASASMIQRVFKLGYSRSAEIIDQLTELGVIDQDESIYPRKVRMKRSQFDLLVNYLKL